jgi:alanyl-tRNA synthetase
VGAAVEELPARIDALRTQLGEKTRQLTHALTAQALGSGIAEAKLSATPGDAVAVGPAFLVARRADGMPPEALKGLVDDLAARYDSVVVLAASAGDDGRVHLASKISEDVVAKGAHAGNLVREVAAACGGGGGGKPTFAQAGGRDASKLDEALALAKNVLAKQLGVGEEPS